MAEEPSERRDSEAGLQSPVGRVLIIGAGVAGIRAANDLAVVGYEVKLTDRVASTRDLLARLVQIPANEQCGLCEMVPEHERRVAAYYCMRSSLTAFSDRITMLPGEVTIEASGDGETSADGDDAAFIGSVEGERLELDAVIFAGSALEDARAEEQLAALVSSLATSAPATVAGPIDAGPATQVPGLFACGAAAGVTEIETALVSGTAAASAASRFLHQAGRGFVSNIKRVDTTDHADLRTIPVVKQALVVGGGVAGMHAALSLADRGVDVQLIEASAELGADAPEDQRELATELASAVANHDKVAIHKSAKVVQSSGTVGRFLTVVRGDDEEEVLLPHGATILTEVAGLEAAELGKVFRVEHDEGRLQPAAKWKPLDFISEGIYLARAEDALPRTMLGAEAAAHRAFRYLSKEEITTARVVARVSHEICSTCDICISLCPYEARSQEEPGGQIVINDRVCEGCGVCAANCPDDATDLVGTADPQTMTMIDSALEGLNKLLP